MLFAIRMNKRRKLVGRGNGWNVQFWVIFHELVA